MPRCAVPCRADADAMLMVMLTMSGAVKPVGHFWEPDLVGLMGLVVLVQPRILELEIAG